MESQMSFAHGLRDSPWGVLPFDCVRKRFIGFYRFKKGGGFDELLRPESKELVEAATD